MSSYRRSHPLLRPGQGEREFLPCITHTAPWCATLANWTLEIPLILRNTRFLTLIDNFGWLPDDRYHLESLPSHFLHRCILTLIWPLFFVLLFKPLFSLQSMPHSQADWRRPYHVWRQFLVKWFCPYSNCLIRNTFLPSIWLYQAFSWEGSPGQGTRRSLRDQYYPKNGAQQHFWNLQLSHDIMNAQPLADPGLRWRIK